MTRVSTTSGDGANAASQAMQARQARAQLNEMTDGVDSASSTQGVAPTAKLAKGNANGTPANGTLVQMLPNGGSMAAGVTSGVIGGGAFLLMPNQSSWDAVRSGLSPVAMQKLMSKSTLFVTGSGAVKALAAKLKVDVPGSGVSPSLRGKARRA
jgi:hypothetical protein